MPLFQIDIQKTDGTHFWTNRYIVNSADVNTAHAAGNTVLVPAEQAMHTTLVTLNKIRTATFAPNDNIFRTNALSAVGTQDVRGEILPLFNVVRVDLSTSEGRPSRKYYRLGLGSDDVIAGYKWNASTLASISTQVLAIREGLNDAEAPLVDPQGEDIFGHTMQNL